ncbi:16S rRNA (guanine(527)-N(7))-methyltransferase RsmG [Carnobacteriaceae bacterium zg-84]|uniref:16S rRNA (guanine(527)-N(7))-methyltransferase RsmG n=1 Tax=Granulicatella sp. zg-84 TaxID=2678503 RepID=UPI0013BF5FC5|nr:16S rRNA (guanine(527)-N(7))-methyltransferase RsmG [Granulicatella sp. zg-84]NEW66089.1 16S rRNA (guanine(527)-N(7))-methyltransferase RsmG [Granulicatella sp. zg-84]QMI85470.1 16S rRNA (guanine(527)-N(7))-methyltransferase RsmG [Carnobacteriaceae bacterium zg-84]
MTPEQFILLLEKQGIHLTKEQEKQYDTYYRMLVEWNEKMNLTAITDQADVYLKHFYDCLTLAIHTDLLNEPIRVCDVGAGAGFPSIPLKIALPHLHITIVDSLNKRITFLNELVRVLALKDVVCYHDRAEQFGQNKVYRETFDIVTARAVARLNLLTEFCLPLVKKGGYFVSMKAASTQEEKEESQKAITLLGGQLVDDISFELPQDAGSRHIIIVKKTKETPNKYPRKAGIPAKSPIR